jgi:CheY-like chemotaxis protein
MTKRPDFSALFAASPYPDRQRTLAAGFDHHLVKPLNMKTLFSILGQFQ